MFLNPADSSCLHTNYSCLVSQIVSEDNAGLFSQGVKPASYSKISDPEIKEIIGECICHRWEER